MLTKTKMGVSRTSTPNIDISNGCTAFCRDDSAHSHIVLLQVKERPQAKKYNSLQNQHS